MLAHAVASAVLSGLRVSGQRSNALRTADATTFDSAKHAADRN